MFLKMMKRDEAHSKEKRPDYWTRTAKRIDKTKPWERSMVRNKREAGPTYWTRTIKKRNHLKPEFTTTKTFKESH